MKNVYYLHSFALARESESKKREQALEDLMLGQQRDLEQSRIQRDTDDDLRRQFQAIMRYKTGCSEKGLFVCLFPIFIACF